MVLDGLGTATGTTSPAVRVIDDADDKVEANAFLGIPYTQDPPIGNMRFQPSTVRTADYPVSGKYVNPQRLLSVNPETRNFKGYQATSNVTSLL